MVRTDRLQQTSWQSIVMLSPKTTSTRALDSTWCRHLKAHVKQLLNSKSFKLRRGIWVNIISQITYSTYCTLRSHFRLRILWQPVNKRQGFVKVLSCLFQSFVPWNHKVFTFDLFYVYSLSAPRWQTAEQRRTRTKTRHRRETTLSLAKTVKANTAWPVLRDLAYTPSTDTEQSGLKGLDAA